jgi:phage shock protein A
MGYRIRTSPEVDIWLGELRESDPRAAGLVDEALGVLREAGPDLGPPLVIPFEEPARDTGHYLDHAYQRQLEMLTRVRRAVADVATAGKRLELQIGQLEEQLSKLEDQRARALEAGDQDLAAEVRTRHSAISDHLADLRRQYAGVRDEEKRIAVASQRLQLRVDAFRTRKEAVKAAETAAEAAELVHEAESALAEAVADAAAGAVADAAAGAVADAAAGAVIVPEDPASASSPRDRSPLMLRELRPGAPESAAVRLLFTVEHPDTAVILAAGTERDWLRAWYAEAALRCRVRYERDHRSRE